MFCPTDKIKSLSRRSAAMQPSTTVHWNLSRKLHRFETTFVLFPLRMFWVIFLGSQNLSEIWAGICRDLSHNTAPSLRPEKDLIFVDFVASYCFRWLYSSALQHWNFTKQCELLILLHLLHCIALHCIALEGRLQRSVPGEEMSRSVPCPAALPELPPEIMITIIIMLIIIITMLIMLIIMVIIMTMVYFCTPVAGDDDDHTQDRMPPEIKIQYLPYFPASQKSSTILSIKTCICSMQLKTDFATKQRKLAALGFVLSEIQNSIFKNFLNLTSALSNFGYQIQ